jgi:hypothetical protein
VHRETSGSPFFVRDETGIAMVYPRGAECRVTCSVEEECLGLAPPEPYASWLARQRFGGRHLLRLSSVRFRERRIEEGQPVYVLGSAEPRAQAVTISEFEEQATGTDGFAVGLRRERVTTLDREASAVIRRGRNDPTYLISASSERALTIDLMLAMWLRLAGGPLLTLAGFGYWMFVLSRRGG